MIDGTAAPAPRPARAVPEVAEHFESFEQQEHAAHLGMWLFLTSEILLFGALFALYTGYRVIYSHEFMVASHHNNVAIGTTNTLILITSSFLAAWAVHAVRHDRRLTVLFCLFGTVALGVCFLGLKSLEYREHFAEGIFPGASYAFAALPERGAAIFFTLYYFMTGLHALHVIGGLVALTVVALRARARRYSAASYTSLELSVLYWHLVDVIWIFLWPLMYLVG